MTNLFVSVGHLANKIQDYFGDGSKFGVNINYIVEDTPLGSGGALYYVKNKVKKDFVVCSGDTIFDIDISRMLKYHKRKKASITLLTHPNSHPYDSDIMLTDRFDRVRKILLKNNHEGYIKNNVNAGFFIVSPSALEYFDQPKKVNMEHDFVNSLISQGDRVYAYRSSEYIKDVGTPERFYKTEQEILNGLVSKRNLSVKQKAIFLDRDGTINEYKGFIRSEEDLVLSGGVIDAVKQINKSEYLAIVISNQPVIARGEATFSKVNKIFDKMETLLGSGGAFVDGIFYCPHHPHSGFKGEVKRLKKDCDCRKPKIGMLLKAQKQFNLDLEKCIMVGDSNLDVLTAKNANIPSVKVKSAIIENATEPPTYQANDIGDAIAYILKNY